MRQQVYGRDVYLVGPNGELKLSYKEYESYFFSGYFLVVIFLVVNFLCVAKRLA
jgi:hypothetical protein